MKTTTENLCWQLVERVGHREALSCFYCRTESNEKLAAEVDVQGRKF